MPSMTGLQRPLYDLRRPSVDEVLSSAAEHFDWARLTADTRAALASALETDGATQNLQAAAADKAIRQMDVSYHLTQTSVDFGRSGAFALAGNGDFLVLGGQVTRDVGFNRQEYDGGADSDDERPAATVQQKNQAARAGYRVDKAAKKAKRDKREASSTEKEEAWARRVGQENDASSLGSYSKVVLCDSQVVLPDVAAQIRGGGHQLQTRCSHTPHRCSQASHTAATCGSWLVVYGAKALLLKYRLQPIPTTRNHLPLSWCSGGPAPPVDGDAGAPLSCLWTECDLLPGTSRRVQAGAQSASSSALLRYIPNARVPLGGSRKSRLLADANNNRLLLLTSSLGGGSWQLCEIVPEEQPVHHDTLDALLEHCTAWKLSAPMDCKGRLVSVKYEALFACEHDGMLYMLVCPDEHTLAQQRPCTMRVYVLQLSTLQWDLLSPRSRNATASEQPLPRKDAACSFHAGKIYMHGGVSVTTGHGCLSDLWTFSVHTAAWRRIVPSSDKPRAMAKLALQPASLMAARSHCCTVLEGGDVVLFGGVDAVGGAVRQLQLVAPLVCALPGGVPTDVRPDLRLRCAGHLAALMHVRSLVAKAVLRSHGGTALVEARSGGKCHRLKVPVAVLGVHSAMVHAMIQDEVLSADSDSRGGDAAMQVLPANPRDTAEAVGVALRWVMGLRTCLTCSVPELAGVFSVADHFQMPALRIEALSVMCCKASVDDIATLQHLMDVHNADVLRPCLQALKDRKRKAELDEF